MATARAQAQPAELQHPELRISNFAKEIDGGGDEESQLIRVEVQHEGRDRWEEVSQKQLQEYQRAGVPFYEVYYKYEQSLLVPRPEQPCHLHVWIADPQEPAGNDDRIRAWYQKYRLTVAGNYVDQAVQLYEIDFKTHKLRRLAGDISDVAALVVTPERPKLLIADGAEAVVLEHDLTTSKTRKRISDKYLREPRAVQIHKRGHVWVGDAWARALLEFSSDEGPPKRYAP